MTNDPLIKELAEAFLRWPLPGSVCADHCTTYPVHSDNPALQRVGTNLLSYAEAEKMFTDLAGPVLAALRKDNAALWADKERLDWLDETFSGVERFARHDEWIVQRYQQVCGCIGHGRTVRDAIDAARSALGKEATP